MLPVALGATLLFEVAVVEVALAGFGEGGVTAIDDIALESAPQDAVVQDRIGAIRLREMHSLCHLGPIYAAVSRLRDDQVGGLRRQDRWILAGQFRAVEDRRSSSCERPVARVLSSR